MRAGLESDRAIPSHSYSPVQPGTGSAPVHDRRTGVHACRVQSNLPVGRGVDERRRRQLPAAERRAQLRRGLRAIETERGELAGGPGLEARPANGVREVPFAIGGDDRAVTGVLALERERFLAGSEDDRIGDDDRVRPPAAVVDLVRVGGIDGARRRRPARRRSRLVIAHATRALWPMTTPGLQGEAAPMTFQPGAFRCTR